MLSSMFCVTRVSPRSKKMALAGRAMGVPGPGRVFHGIRLVAGPQTYSLRLLRGLSRRAVLCRGSQLLLRFLGEGSSRLKLILASFAFQGAQSGTVDHFSNGRLSVEVSVRISRSQIACPDSGSGLILGDFSVAESYLSTLVAPALNCIGKF